MKYIIFVTAILCAGTSFSQSKKKQIALLTHQLDSVSQKLSSVNQKLDSMAQVNNRLKDLQLQQENMNLRLQIAATDQAREMKSQYVTISELSDRIKELESNQVKPAEPKVEKNTPTNLSNKPATNYTNSPSNNPFGSGHDNPFGTGGGSGPGSGTGTGSQDGIGFGTRSRLSNVDVQNISIETDAKIYYKLTIDADGNVVAFTYYGSKTTTTDLTLINKIGYEIKKQVKYSKKQNAPLVYVDYTVSVKAN